MSTPTGQTAFDLVAAAKQSITTYTNDAASLSALQQEIAGLKTQETAQSGTVASDIEAVNTGLQQAAAALLALQIPVPPPPPPTQALVPAP